MNKIFACFLSITLLLLDQSKISEGSKKGSGSRGSKLGNGSPIKSKPSTVKISSGKKGTSGGYGIGGVSNGYSRNSYGASNNKVALSATLGAIAGGYVGYKFGKISGRYSTYNGRNYYYGYNNYESSSKDNRRDCYFAIDESTPEWTVLDPDTNNTVDELVFECLSTQSCCDVECCNEWEWWHIILILLAVAMMCCVFVCCALKFCRKKVDDQTNEYTDSVYTTEKPTTPLAVHCNHNQIVYFPADQSAYPKKQLTYPANITQTQYYSNLSQTGFDRSVYQPVPTNASPYE